MVDPDLPPRWIMAWGMLGFICSCLLRLCDGKFWMSYAASATSTSERKQVLMWRRGGKKKNVSYSILPI